METTFNVIDLRSYIMLLEQEVMKCLKTSKLFVCLSFSLTGAIHEIRAYTTYTNEFNRKAICGIVVYVAVVVVVVFF